MYRQSGQNPWNCGQPRASLVQKAAETSHVPYFLGCKPHPAPCTKIIGCHNYAMKIVKETLRTSPFCVLA